MPDVIIIASPGPQGPPGPPGSGASTFPFTGSATISGSLVVTGSVISTQGFTGSLFGSSSYALTASFALNGGESINTGSLLTTASVNLNTITFIKGDGSTFPITVNTGSGGGGGSTFPYTGSALITGSLIVTGSTVSTLGFTGSLLGTASYSNQALSSSYALTASFALNAGTAINTGSFVTTSSFNSFTSSINNFTSSYSTGSFTGSFTGSLLGTSSYSNQALSSSYALTASFALNGGGGSTNTGSLLTTASVNLNIITFTKGDGSTFPITVNTGSGGGGGSTFPYTGSAIISGSLDLNGPLNVDIRNFNIDNDVFTQNALFNSSSISLNTISNQVAVINQQWRGSTLTTSSITSGSTFTATIDASIGDLPSIGTKLFYSGSQSDSYGISQYKFLGIVTSTSSYYDQGQETTYNVVTASAYITTSSLNTYPVDIRFYNTGSGLGTINLNGNTNISGSTTIGGSTTVNGTLNVSSSISAPLYLISGSEFRGNLQINGTASINNTLIIGNNNSNKKYLQFGRASVSLLASDTNFIILSRNIQSGFDTTGDINTRIQFNQGYDWQYTLPEPTETYYGINTGSYLDFKRDNVNFNIIELNYVGQGYNTQLNDGTAPLLPAKGFHTDYNGTAYFNVTGSVSASAYYGNGSNLTGVIVNPFTGTFIVNGTASINGILTSSIANLNTINSINGINGVYISGGSGSRTTNLVIGDTRALSVITPGVSAVNGQNLIAIGSGSLLAATTTFRNIALGNNVMPLVTNNGSNNNIGIGYDVFTVANNSLTNNIAIGNSASFGTTSGDNNIAIGTEALFSNTTQNNNIGIGLRAGRTATGAAASIFIGTDAGANVTSGDNNIAIGFEALKFQTTSGNNIAIGFQAMVSGSGAQDSIAIGANTLSKITTGDFNLAIGANALATITTANGNLAIGTDCMISSSATIASNNTSIGFQSLQQITGSNNVVFGYRTMQGFRSGSNNTVIGYNSVSGSGISGSNNTIIGGNVVLPDGVYNNRIIIADGQGNQRITVSGSITTISGSLNITGSGAILTLQPQSPLPTVGIPTGSFAVSSSIPAKPFFWDGSIWNALY